VVGALDSGKSTKSNRSLATRSAGEGRCAVESVVTDELDFENAAQWLATEWGQKHEEDDKAVAARDAALKVGTSGGGAGDPGSALQHFGTGYGGEGGGGGGGGGCDCPPDCYRTTSEDTDKKPEPSTSPTPIGASYGARAQEMPDRMKMKDPLLIDRIQGLLLSQGVSQKLVSFVQPSHASLQKWMAKRQLIPTNNCDGQVQSSIALIRAISIKTLIKDTSLEDESCTICRSAEEEAKGTNPRKSS